jgi:hypothetical protein
MSSLHGDLWLILDAVHILSPTRFKLLGEVRDLSAATAGGNRRAEVAPGADADGIRLVSALEVELYDRLYTRPSSRRGNAADMLARRDLVAALSAANSGHGAWEPGWTIDRFEDDGHVAVAKDGLTFWVTSDGLRSENGMMRPGMSCRVRVPKELRGLAPGFYLAIGDGEGDPDDRGDDGEPLLRYYWNLTSAAAVPFMRATTTLLNAARIPFRVKVLADPLAYERADAGVLYMRRRYYERLGDAIARIHDAVAPGLRAETPLFCKRLADGLGLAEDPNGESSFGQERCKLVAQALWCSFRRDETDGAARAATLEAEFRRAGLDPLRPHLGPDSPHDYALRPLPITAECLHAPAAARDQAAQAS